ncbi:MAG TPA: hypothetical protein VJP83_06080, partial [Terriglobales bacterium]|nr:hypothetical protein [Terriglobales bacterium]
PAGACAVTLPHSAVQPLVVSAQDQPLTEWDVIETHRELYQHCVHYLERIQHVPGIAPADHPPA